MNNKELKIVNEQILATILFITALFISLTLAYNQKRKIQNHQTIYKDSEVKKIAIANRIFIILIVLFYLYIDNENLSISNHKNKNLRKMQCYLELLYLFAAFIALYITIKSNNATTENENPGI